MLRKFGRRISHQNTDSVQADGEPQDSSNGLIDADDEKTEDGPCGRKFSSASHQSLPPRYSALVSGGVFQSAPISEESDSDDRTGSLPQENKSLAVLSRIDAFGLTLVHASRDPLVDMVFVHGLGGTSTRTWSWKRDPRNCWLPWLGQEPTLQRSRIFTFGYQADLSREYTSLNILDFAKELLFWMKTYSNAGGFNDHPIGKYPLVFVMHSLGGLVVKKAYIIGRSDEQYSGITSQIRAMLFLATPHRGSAYADFLNSVLQTTPGVNSKIYISELEKASTSLQDINEQFRSVCGNIELVSLYENQRTSIGLGMKKTIVDKESAVLGYPNETSSGLSADHHGVCKFHDRSDPNYVQVRNVLHMFIKEFNGPVDQSHPKLVSAEQRNKLQELLGVYDDLTEDFEMLHDRILNGSCEWLLRRPMYTEWRTTVDNRSKILWLAGLPGTGKSVLSSFVVDSIDKDTSVENCFYYFFKSEHQRKRTIGYMLRAIAFQAAMTCEPFRTQILELYATGSSTFSGQKVKIIWETIFEGILFRQQLDQPIFWVIDGLDEADHPDLFLKLLSRLRSSNAFRILIVSRPMRDHVAIVGKKLEVVHDEITLRDTFRDIKAYTKAILSSMLPADEVHHDISSKVLEKSRGSFLWVTLALDQLKDNWHTKGDVVPILNDLPEGMEPMYVRMLHAVAIQAPSVRTIATKILTFATCAFRPFELRELEVALASEFGDFLSLKDTITQICGNFVIAEKSRVALIHDTARNFLLKKTKDLPLNIEHRLGHEALASACLRFLMDSTKNWKRVFTRTPGQDWTKTRLTGDKDALFEMYPFLSYAVTWWPYHASQSPRRSDLISLILEFLENHCLIWINAVALLGDMRILTRAAQYLNLYLKRRNKKNVNDSPISLNGTRNDELKLWVKDIIRVMGRFGNILLQSPQSVYRHILPFCPRGSIMRQTYGNTSSLSVVGLSRETWDDCLARLTMGVEEFASKVFCQGNYFLTLAAGGVLIVWDAESCAEARRINHSGWVTAVGCSTVSSLVATAGKSVVRIWDITTGQEVYTISDLLGRRILNISFGTADDELLIGYDDASIQSFDLASSTEKWRVRLIESEDPGYNCPHLISFSPDNDQVLVGYRGKPLLGWTLGSLGLGPRKCADEDDLYCAHGDSRRAPTPESAVWRPGLPSVLVIYNDNTLLEWDIEDDTHRVIPGVGAREMTISPDGNLLLTSDHNGTLSVWTVPEFRLTCRIEDRDIVRSLAFSPDGQRFYDIRSNLCNVWEPDALVRPDDLDKEEFSSTQDTGLSEPLASETSAARDQITALVPDAQDRFYARGDEKGTVALHDMKTGERVRKLYSHSTVASVIEMAWSASTKHIASADDGGRVIAKRLRKPTDAVNRWAVYPSFEFRLGEAISQLLFSPSEEYLLVSSTVCDVVWNLKEKRQICRRDHPSSITNRWINHPVHADQVLCIDAQGTRPFLWQSLTPLNGDANKDGQSDFGNNPQGIETTAVPDLGRLKVDDALPTEKPFIIQNATLVEPSVVISDVAGSGPRRNSTTVTSYDITISCEQELEPELVEDLSAQVNRLIGSFHGHLVFLDRQYRFCTWDPRRGLASLKRHFFLPKDWLSPGMLELCVINSYGTILCPKDGEVAIIRSGIKL